MDFILILADANVKIVKLSGIKYEFKAGRRVSHRFPQGGGTSRSFFYSTGSTARRMTASA